MLGRATSDSDGKFKLYYFGQNNYRLIVAWSSKNSGEAEKWPEGTSFRVERNIKLEENTDLEIDMQNDLVTNTKTSQIIEKE